MDVVSVGLDIGTMNLVNTSDLNKESILLRNVFLKVNLEDLEISSLSSITYIKDELSNSAYIIGNDAFSVANIFGLKVSRPMFSGLISPTEIDSIDIMALMFSFLLKDELEFLSKGGNIKCGYSIPGNPIDSDRSVIYHQRVMERILVSLGIPNPIAVNEAHALIFDNLEKYNFSGIGISFGAGMTNVCIAYKGVAASTFSTSIAGDWIDDNCAKSLNVLVNRVTQVKEKKLDLTKDFSFETDKRVRRILEALHYYYKSMIDYTIKNIVNKFKNDINVEIDEELPIVVSGGTAMVNGFVDLFSNQILKNDLPFSVSSILKAENPLYSVSRGIWKKISSS